jgi:hypothetical protein
MAYAGIRKLSNIAKRRPCISPRSTLIQELLLPEKPIPSLSEDENLVLWLRLRDGVPNPVPNHRRTGACKYARVYGPGECDWCKALDRREEASQPAQPNGNVIVMGLRFQHAEEDVVAMRRIA